MECSAREEHGNDSEQHEDNDCHKENAIAESEIPFGLERKQCETQTNCCRCTDSQQHLYS